MARQATITPRRRDTVTSRIARGRGQQVARWALAEAYGRAVTEIGEGGSIPLVAAFHAAAPDADLILLGLADPSSQMHAPNESVDLDELERCTLAEVLFLAGLAACEG